jgi:kinesin family member 5
MSGIRVICRLRPENKVESESGGHQCVEYTSTSLKLVVQDRPDETSQHEFTFDQVCGPEIHQSEVFEFAAKPVVDGVLKGYNGTIFAYGQTGSGKTFTMEGPDIMNTTYKGIIPRMMDALFEGLVNASESSEFTLKVSFLEIYLERIHDLLDPSKNNLQVKEDKTRGIYVQDASEVYVGSPIEMLKVMSSGSANRSIAATRMNQRSSRSHSIFCVYVEQKDTQAGSKTSGKLYFVDLAGSESVGKTNVSGKQLEEAKMINKSLSALGNVINALTEKNPGFVPYRDSKLTRILQESLGGNSQTTLVIACSMNSYNDKETLSTLRFGARAKKIQNKPIVNQEKSAKELIKQLEMTQKEINKQAEIINSIKLHIGQNYSTNLQLVSEVSEIIQGSFAIQQSKTPVSKAESENSFILLKQHIEIVKLNEDLQQVKVEKQELEDELQFRNKDLRDYEIQVASLQSLLQEEKESHSFYEKVFNETQQNTIELGRISKACERLRSNLVLVYNEIPKTEQWAEILLKSIQDTLGVMQILDNSDNKIQSSDMSTIIEDKVNNSEESFLMEYKDVVSDSSLDSSKIENKQLKLTELAAEIEKLKATLETKNKKIEKIKEKVTQKDNQLETLRKQLDMKVKNIEEERASVLLDMKYKEEEIQELKKMLAMERERLVQNLRLDTPKQRIIDMEDRLKQLSIDRQQLFEEIVNLKKNIDHKDEQIDKLTMRNERLERQANFQGYKSYQSNQNLPVEVNALTKKVRKPIKGGGGDIWNFQKNNQNILNIEVSDAQKKTHIKLQKLRNSQGGGIQAIVKDLFGGFLG